jgi:hypothetical protein
VAACAGEAAASARQASAAVQIDGRTARGSLCHARPAHKALEEVTRQ